MALGARRTASGVGPVSFEDLPNRSGAKRGVGGREAKVERGREDVQSAWRHFRFFVVCLIDLAR